MMDRTKRILGLLTAIDPRDAFAFAGIGLVGYGLSLFCEPAAFIVPGAILVYMALFGGRR